MSLSANRDVPRYADQELRTLPVKAATHIFRGALVGIDRSGGYARMLAAGDLFAGIAYDECDNPGGNGEKSCRVYTHGDFHFAVAGATTTAIGRPLFALAEDGLTLTPGVSGSHVGVCVDVPATGQVVARIEPWLASQTMLSASATLASSTSVATINPVFITQRAIVVMSAQVCFNTKPDAGVLDVGYGNVNPNEIVTAAGLGLLTNNQPSALSIAAPTVPGLVRVWARVGQATSAAGVGGLLTIRYFELP